MSNPPPLLRLLLLIMLVCPPMVMANMGTPLMWATLGHLMLGNVIIGLMEGWMLMRWFGATRGKALGGLIIGNFFSAFVGVVVLQVWVFERLSVDLNNELSWVWLMVGLAYVLTLVLEWPFVYWSLKKAGPHRLSQSVKASLLIQTVSYLLLAGWYGGASQISLYTEVKVVPSGEMFLPANVQVHYISTVDGLVYRRMLAGGAEQKVSEEILKDRNDILSFKADDENPGHWDLILRRSNPPGEQVLLQGLPQDKAPFWPPGKAPRTSSAWSDWGEALKLGMGPDVWSMTSSVWAGGGLTVRNLATRERFSVAFETPFGQWSVRNVWHLPQGLAMFQLGRDQICVLDPATRRVALLWRGREAVCTLTDE